MPLTADQIDRIRDEIGVQEPPDDGELDDKFDRLGNLTSVVVEVLRRRIADLRNQPLSFSIAGEYSENRAGNLKALEEQLARVEAQGIPGDGRGPTAKAIRLTRKSIRRPALDTEESLMRGRSSGRGR